MASCHLLLVFVIAAIIPWSSAQIKCYTCAGTNDDRTCIDNPAALGIGPPIADCCTIIRREHGKAPGRFTSFSREWENINCKNDGVHTVVKGLHTTYTTYCSKPLCNVGDGTDDGSKGSSIDGLSHSSSNQNA